MRNLTRSAVGAAIAAGTVLAASPANAAYVINFNEVGSTVVMNASGSVNLAGLTRFGAGGGPTATLVGPNSGTVFVERPGGPNIFIYRGFTGPLSFGPSSNTSAIFDVVSHVFLFSASSPNPGLPPGRIGLSASYISGTELGTNTALFNGSLASLGLTQGTYTWNWGSGANADSLTINIGTAVPPGAIPEPAIWAMLILGFGAVGGALRRRKRPALQYC